MSTNTGVATERVNVTPTKKQNSGSIAAPPNTPLDPLMCNIKHNIDAEELVAEIHSKLDAESLVSRYEPKSYDSPSQVKKTMAQQEGWCQGREAMCQIV